VFVFFLEAYKTAAVLNNPFVAKLPIQGGQGSPYCHGVAPESPIWFGLTVGYTMPPPRPRFAGPNSGLQGGLKCGSRVG